MPPRSTKRAEFGDILDDALAALADFQFGQQLGFLFGPLGLDQRPAADDDVPPRLVDLQHEALDGLADIVADVGRAADIDLAGRQKDVHADIDQQPALDLARGHARNDVALVDGLHHLQPGLDLLGLAFAQGDHAAGVVDQAVDILDVLDKDFDLGAGLGKRFTLFPFVAEDDAFALVAHVDQHDIAFNAKHAPDDDLVQLHFLGGPGDFLGRNALERFVQLMLPFFFAKIESSYQVAVDHKGKLFTQTHSQPRSSGPSTSSDSLRTIGEPSSLSRDDLGSNGGSRLPKPLPKRCAERAVASRPLLPAWTGNMCRGVLHIGSLSPTMMELCTDRKWLA